MPLVKHGAEIANAWTFVPDGAVLPGAGLCSVSLARFLALQRGEDTGRVPHGVRLGPADAPDDLAPHLERLKLIEIDFPRYTDGRGYSQAQLLRRRFGYTGELRAVGHVLRDQIFYMHRSGFDAFETRRAGLTDVLEALAEFSEVYQPSASGPEPVFRKRNGA